MEVRCSGVVRATVMFPPSLRCFSKHRGRNEGSSPHTSTAVGSETTQARDPGPLSRQWNRRRLPTVHLAALLPFCPPAEVVELAAAPSRAPLAELAAGERPLERAVELLRLKR